MSDKKKASSERLDKVIADARRAAEERGKGYREQALKLYPWICGRCSREFTRKNLSELTVHHRDHNHDNNPTDGSNWELLCLFCHDNEHSRLLEAGNNMSSTSADAATQNPFAALKSMMDKKDN